jgi:ABC-type multidrug transport system ATPase subunit
MLSPALQAYVEQNDNFYSMLTVAETLTMSSQLQLSPGMPADAKASYVDNLISVLGLAKVRATVAVPFLPQLPCAHASPYW